MIRASPSWTEAQVAHANLRGLAENATPYDQMDHDRDAVIRYAEMLQRSLDSILYALAVGTHLATLTRGATAAQKMEDGLRALAEGLDLASLDEIRTRSELEQCMREFDPKLQTEVAAGLAAVNGDPAVWRKLLDDTLEKIRLTKLTPGDESQAWDNWKVRLLAYAQPDPADGSTPSDINYLRCRAAGLLVGTILKGRLRNTTPREWSLAYISAMSDVLASANPPPLWFPWGLLATLGFGASPELIGDGPDAAVAKDLHLKIALASSPRRGVIVIRSPSNSITDTWRDAKPVPTLIFTAAEYGQCKRFDQRSYFERRLYGILVEVAADEKPDQILKSSAFREIEGKLPSARMGLLLAARLEAASGIPTGWGSVVAPRDAATASSQAFAPAAQSAGSA